MSKDNKSKIEALKSELEGLTKLMDVPCFRYSNIKWLQKNLAVRNSNHPSFAKAQALISELIKLGAS